jgi:hypothetical protein
MKTARLIYGVTPSRCCNAKTVLVRSRAGGFVTRNCLQCGRPGYLNIGQFSELECEWCDSTLHVRVNGNNNYSFKCGGCGKEWDLPTMLPDWSELFPYHGLAAPGDPGFLT